MLSRKKIIIVFVLVIVVLAVIVYFWSKQRNVNQIDLTNINQAADGLGGELPTGETGEETSTSQTPSKVITEADKDKTQIEKTAKFFIEMLGSYSADAKFQNIIDLKPMMTNKMKDWADAFISQNLASLDENRERVTTQVFKTEFLNYSESEASLLVYTRRDKIGNQGEKLYNQEAQVELVKIGGNWKVDEVQWK